MAPTDFERNLEKYAEVIIKVGLNLSPGQRLLIGMPTSGVDGTPLEAYPLVRKVMAAAYNVGARFVGVNWDDEELQRIRVQHAPLDTMSESAYWKTNSVNDFIDNGDAVMAIFGQRSGLLNGLDAAKVKAKQQTEAENTHKWRPRLADATTNWLIVGAATTSWAASVFPDLSPDDAIARLWEAIFDICRVKHNDPVAEWQRHLASLKRRNVYLNDKRYAALHYKAPGTDLTVGLPEGHIWHSGALASRNGINFVANLPTEEVFTMPHKDHIDGVVTATKPLNYRGRLIEDFTLKFSEGMVVNASAKSGQDALDNLLNTDKTSRSLGEVALVPHSSPISQSGLLFYCILFDENASDHLALGNAYRFSMQGGDKMSADDFAAAGGNESMTHADFMIGSSEMDIDGVHANGTIEPLMRKGEWAFDIH